MAGTDGLDERFVSTNTLEEYFVDKDTGTPLAAGSVEFWQDDSRVTPKLVYQLTGDPSNVGGYTYDPLPNPITLSGVGTLQNAGGDNIPIYYFPYQGTPDNSDGNPQLYYVVVKDYLGVVQFTRSAWPTISTFEDEAENTGLQTNQISNSQFVDFGFFTDNKATISYIGINTTITEIVPDWFLSVSHNGSGTIRFEREPIAGSSNFPTNPPYWLHITPGANITNLELVQPLPHNPGIWSTDNDGVIGYVNAGLLLDAGSSAGMYYVPSSGSPSSYELFNVTNNSGAPKYFSGTQEIFPSTNTDDGDTGDITIRINLSTDDETRLSSVQVIGAGTLLENVPYIQDTVNRQEDHLFHYYKLPLMNKAIPSFLIGWDFPLNPAQFGGSTVAAGLGADESQYVWDQTILFQTAPAAYSVTRDAVGSIKLTCEDDSQFALVQYLGQEEARALLATPLSVQVKGRTNIIDGLLFTVSLWYTTDVSLPSMSSNLSLIDTVDASGFPVSFNGNWQQVFTSDFIDRIGVLPFGDNDDGEPISFSYWNERLDSVPVETATYFAIVLGTAETLSTADISFSYISLVPGTIATPPAPQTAGQVLQECQNYYQKSYESTAPEGTQTFIGAKSAPMTTSTGGSNTVGYATSFCVDFMQAMREVPLVSLYAPAVVVLPAINKVSVCLLYYAGSPQRTAFVDAVITNWTNVSFGGAVSTSRAVYDAIAYSQIVTRGATVDGGSCSIFYHFTADARLGIV